mgnify:CR=1 FL=1
MAISKVGIRNFKGISEQNNITIRPLTFFIGPNSSGKSSCIHALACLSQTLKIPNNTKHLVLDDEYANVHLGRFIDVIHSKSYQDEIELSIELNDTSIYEPENSGTTYSGALRAEYTFKSTMRTQETSLIKAIITIGSLRFELIRKGVNYTLKEFSSGKSLDNIALTNITNVEITAFSKDYIYLYILFNQINNIISSEIRKVLYLGPFRQQPLRAYPTYSSSPNEVGALGEATVTILANETIKSHTREHSIQINRWLNMMGLGKTIDVSRIERSQYFNVLIELEQSKKFALADLGYGLSQVLPVLTQCSFAEKNTTLLFEQPELHLHSIAARGLAEVFAECINNKNLQIVAETHSPDLLQAVQGLLRNGKLKYEDVIAYKVRRINGSTSITPINIDHEDYDIWDDWEDGLTR